MTKTADIKKETIDRTLQENWGNITSKIDGYLKHSKTPVELDVIGYAYEELMRNKHKLMDEKDVISHFLTIAKMATKWSNCQYFKHKNKKELIMDNNEMLDYFDNLNDNEEVHYQPNVIDKFLEVADTQEKLVLNLILQGYSTSGKLSHVTKIPRTTCYYLIKNIKDKLKTYEI